MNVFPEFMKNPTNRIARSNQATAGVEGYVFDGKDGSQMAFWTCSEDALSVEHVHDYDEYMLVVQGCYTLVVNGKRIPINAGEEYFIGSGVVRTLVKLWLEPEQSTPSEAIAPTANGSMHYERTPCFRRLKLRGAAPDSGWLTSVFYKDGPERWHFYLGGKVNVSTRTSPQGGNSNES